MNKQSSDKFEPAGGGQRPDRRQHLAHRPQGQRTELKTIYVEANALPKGGSGKAANMVKLGAYVARQGGQARDVEHASRSFEGKKGAAR
jgi:hypothetical protein